MVRLTVEDLEGRELLAANVLTASAPVSVTTASVVRESAPAPVVVDFTPPIGSNKGSIMGDGFGLDETGWSPNR